MTDALKLGFGPFAGPAKGVLVVFCDDGLEFGPATQRALGAAAETIARAAALSALPARKIRHWNSLSPRDSGLPG